MDISVIIPTRNGGELLNRTLVAIYTQKTNKTYEVIVIDSESDEETLRIIKNFPVKLFAIKKYDFNHGLTRDLGAAHAQGEFLIFINQDAEPVDENWMNLMIQPMIDNNEILATQGAIKEREDTLRFFWDSCGENFYFSSESNNWIKFYKGIGFSTVNCCIRRSVWEQHHFGNKDILEDKFFQKQIQKNGSEIVYADGCVYHTHNYSYQELYKRCQNEGYGWRLVGERYTLKQAIGDTFILKNYKKLLKGLLKRKINKWAEFIYPFKRAYWVYKGNHFNKKLI